MNNIKCIIFDFGGVIGKPQVMEELDKMIQLSGLSREEFLEKYFSERLEYDGGHIGFEQYWSRILKNSNVEKTSDLFEQLGRADALSWCDFNLATIKLIKDIKESGMKVALLSNINYPILEYLQKETSVLTLFDDLFYSCEMKMIKPNREIYEAVINSLGIKAEESVFIDDSMANVEGAATIGINGIHFESTVKLRQQLGF